MIHTITIPVVVTIDDTEGGMSILTVDVPPPGDTPAERWANAVIARWVSLGRP